jgi:maltose alpha-D-glucosyltransferase / alpha-amylase
MTGSAPPLPRLHAPIPPRAARPIPVERIWFQRAVFYEMLVQACADSNGDGYGDLLGLVDKLDYLQWLGVDCLWLPPFYDSPRRGGGYDIRDYHTVSPEYGTVDDFVTLLDEAHARGIRVITDLVLNHTVGYPPLVPGVVARPERPVRRLLRATRTRTTPGCGSSSATSSRRTGRSTRYGSSSTGTASTTTSPTSTTTTRAGQEAMLDVVRFWLDLGIDGFRLDAATYLYEREGTDCANLPETHAYLKRLRKIVDEKYPGCVLLAEANLWPADLV